MPANTEPLVTLRDGLVVPESVITYLLHAESRGLVFHVVGDRLRVFPASGVRADDDHYIREHRDLLRACVQYCDRMAEVPL